MPHMLAILQEYNVDPQWIVIEITERVFFERMENMVKMIQCLRQVGFKVSMLHMDKVICLGEVMNGHDIIAGPDTKTSRLVRQVKENAPKFPLEGHLPRFLDWDLAQILYNGVNSDHTDQTLETIRQRIAGGCFLQLQEKTIKPEFIQYLVEHNLFEHFAIVTDDTMPDSFMKRGHLNYLVKKAM